MFADVIAKDFEIELDDKPYTVKNERWLGIILNEDAEGDEPYFSAISFCHPFFLKWVMGFNTTTYFGLISSVSSILPSPFLSLCCDNQSRCSLD